MIQSQTRARPEPDQGQTVVGFRAMKIAMMTTVPAMQPEPEENEMPTTGQRTKRQLSVLIGK